MYNKLAIGIASVGTVIMGLVSVAVANAQAFALSTSTEVTNNGAFIQTAYDRVINLLGPTGAVLFMIVMAILGIIVWLAVKAPRHVVSA